MYGMSYDTPGRHTEEDVEIVTTLLRGERVDVDGAEYTVRGVQAALGSAPGELLGCRPTPGAQRQHREGAEERGAT